MSISASCIYKSKVLNIREIKNIKRLIKMGIVEEAIEVLDWIESKVGDRHKIYLKQKMIKATLDAQKGIFIEHKEG